MARDRYYNLPIDQDGFHRFIKERNSKWNLGYQPTQTKLDRYECRHNLSYFIIEGTKYKLTAK